MLCTPQQTPNAFQWAGQSPKLPDSVIPVDYDECLFFVCFFKNIYYTGLTKLLCRDWLSQLAELFLSVLLLLCLAG